MSDTHGVQSAFPTRNHVHQDLDPGPHQDMDPGPHQDMDPGPYQDVDLDPSPYHAMDPGNSNSTIMRGKSDIFF